MSHPRTILCNGAIPPQGKDAGLEGHLRLEYRPGQRDDQNMVLSLPKFVNYVHYLPPRIRDLLEIAGYIYCADRLVKRGEIDDLVYEAWGRCLHFVIKVRDYDFWSQPVVAQKLAELVKFMSGDLEHSYSFQPGHTTPSTGLFDSPEFTIEPSQDTDVILFSGGLDSLAGTVNELTTTERQLCLVSHRSSQPSTTRTQDQLANALQRDFPRRVFPHHFRCHLKDLRATEETQRTRFFLYSTIGFALSQAISNHSLTVYENGVTSLNLTKLEHQKLGRLTRTTHPKTIRLLEQMFSLVAEKDFQIVTPFFWKTKTDVVQVLAAQRRQDLLSSAVSCSKTFKLHAEDGTHCGGCSQCIDRRFAVFAAELEAFDDSSSIYKIKFIRHEIEREEVRATLLDYVRKAKEFANASLDSFYFDRLKDLTDVVDYVPNLTEDEAITRIYELLHRHGEQVFHALKRMRDLYDNLRQPLPKHCLLQMINWRQHLATTTESSSEVGQSRMAVILTALGLECDSICEHLTNRRQETHAQGTVYERGVFCDGGVQWDIAVVEIGAGNAASGIETERAISHFQPDIVLFVGIAGGLKDVRIGDVVAATEVYDYGSGKAKITFEPRARGRTSSYALEQRARAQRRNGNWVFRIPGTPPDLKPKVVVAPIAAGEQVVASTQSASFQLLKVDYGHCAAVEMEGYGFLDAVRHCQGVQGLVIRGISDMVDGKGESDAGGSQEMAARHASAFAFDLLANLGD